MGDHQRIRRVVGSFFLRLTRPRGDFNRGRRAVDTKNKAAMKVNWARLGLRPQPLRLFSSFLLSDSLEQASSRSRCVAKLDGDAVGRDPKAGPDSQRLSGLYLWSNCHLTQWIGEVAHWNNHSCFIAQMHRKSVPELSKLSEGLGRRLS